MRQLLASALLAYLVAVQATAVQYYVNNTAQGDGTCLTDATHACTFQTVWTKNPTAGDTINVAAGTYTGSASMLAPPHPAQPTVTAVTSGGTMTAGRHIFAYTQTCNGVELSPSLEGVQQSGFGVQFGANYKVTLTGVQTSCAYGGGTRTKATIYATRASDDTYFKVGSGCQAPFNDAVTTSATCDPGPDSGWTSAPSPLGISGASGNPLTITATTQYGTTINGQATNPTCLFQNGNSWLVVDGFVCVNPSRQPGTSALEIDGGSYHNRFSHMIAGDAAIDMNNFGILFTDHNKFAFPDTDNTIDRFAVFGTGRKNLITFSTNGSTTATNGILVYAGSEQSGPKDQLSPTYQSQKTHYRDITLFWPGDAMPSSYILQNSACNNQGPPGYVNCSPCNLAGCGYVESPFLFDQPYGMVSGNVASSVPQIGKAFWDGVGLIMIIRANDLFKTNAGTGAQNTTVLLKSGEMTMKDSVVYYNTASPYKTQKEFDLRNCDTCGAPKNMVATSLTGIGGGGNSVSADWTQTDVVHLADASTFKYDGSSGTSKANVCFEHNAALNPTATKRWGTTEATNLNNALISAMAAEGYATISPYSEVVNALGAIPAACDATGPTPTNTPIPNTATNTPTPSNTPTLTPTNTPGGPTPTPTQTPSGCLYWHVPTFYGPGYYAFEPCGLSWPHPHPNPTPTP